MSFPATFSAATTLSIAALCNNHVAKLATHVVETAVYFFVYDDAAANACTDCNHNRMVGVFGSTCVSFAKCRTVCIVAKIDRYIDFCLNKFSQLGVFEVYVCAVQNNSSVRVKTTWYTYTDRVNVFYSKVVVCHNFFAKHNDVGYDFIAIAFCQGRGGLFAYKFEIFIYKTCNQVCTSYIYTYSHILLLLLIVAKWVFHTCHKAFVEFFCCVVAMAFLTVVHSGNFYNNSQVSTGLYRNEE